MQERVTANPTEYIGSLGSQDMALPPADYSPKSTVLFGRLITILYLMFSRSDSLYDVIARSNITNRIVSSLIAIRP